MGLIDANAMMKHLENLLCGNCDTPRKDGWCDVCDYAFLMNEMKKEQTIDAVEVVRCKDCKHRPTGTGVDHDVEFPDDICPCRCEDYWYWPAPDDYFFCAWGERREEEGTVTFYANNKPVEAIVIGEWREKEDETD